MPKHTLTADRVLEIFKACISNPDARSIVMLDGVINRVPLSQAALDEFHAEISALLDLLPEAFNTEVGAPFAAMGMTRHGMQWADSQLTMEHLLVLGLGIGRVEYVLPREEWPSVGGLPIVRIVAGEAS